METLLTQFWTLVGIFVPYVQFKNGYNGQFLDTV